MLTVEAGVHTKLTVPLSTTVVQPALEYVLIEAKTGVFAMLPLVMPDNSNCRPDPALGDAPEVRVALAVPTVLDCCPTRPVRHKRSIERSVTGVKVGGNRPGPVGKGVHRYNDATQRCRALVAKDEAVVVVGLTWLRLRLQQRDVGKRCCIRDLSTRKNRSARTKATGMNLFAIDPH